MTQRTRNHYVVFNAISCSSLVADMLGTACVSGKVHSVFRRSFNWLDIEDRFTSIIFKDVGNVPCGIVVDAPYEIDFRDFGLTPGDSVYASRERVLLPERRMSLTLKEAMVWPAQRIIPIEVLSRKRIISNITNASEFLAINMKNTGLVPLLPTLKDFMVGSYPRGGEIDNLLCRRARASISLFLSGLRFYSMEAVRKGVSDLIGLGVGLTPSGDDFLIGAFGTLVLLAKPLRMEEWIRCMGEMLAGIARVRTTRISEVYLGHAVEGLLPEVLGNFIDAMVGESDEQILIASQRLARIGNSSGLEMGIGSLLAFCFAAEMLGVCDEAHTMNPQCWEHA
jgi:hypothetical protein